MTQKILQIYSQLFKRYGEQHWWPGETVFEIIIGAILTQNTSWANVEKTIKILKDKDLLTPEKIYSLPEKTLAHLIRSSGFYNQKAKRIKFFVEFYADFGFNPEKLKHSDSLREKLLSIKGIGEETADSILLYALETPYFVIDSYTKRLFFRLGYTENENISYKDLQDIFHKALPQDVELYKEYHALIVIHCKEHCKKTPLCYNCPLTTHCKYYIKESNI